MIRYRRRFIDPGDRYRRWIEPRVRTLRLADVTAYLLGRGWTPKPPDRPGFRVFREPGTAAGEDAYCQFLPESEEGADYALRMFELLTGVAELEDRQASTVIDDIVGAGARAQPNGPFPAPPHDAGIPGAQPADAPR